MEVKVLNQEKNMIEVELDSLTAVEILRVYLNRNSDVDFVAWKREHAERNPILRVETKSGNPKKAIEAAVKEIVADLDKVEKEFKSLK